MEDKIELEKFREYKKLLEDRKKIIKRIRILEEELHI